MLGYIIAHFWQNARFNRGIPSDMRSCILTADFALETFVLLMSESIFNLALSRCQSYSATIKMEEKVR
jgi:hypothetical protein